MSKYVGFRLGKVHESHVISEYYCGGCGYPVTDHDSFCPECGGAFRESDASDLEAENVKLRELVALWIVLDKHMSLCATTDCGQCPVREECEESVYLEGLLGIDPKELSWRVQERMAETADVQAENVKLRELVRDMWSSYCYANSGCETFLTDEQDAAIRERVRRLKVINK